MLSNPGAVITLYLWQRDFSDEQHGLKRKEGAAFYAEA
jgi:hypothetical protein